MHLIFSQSGVKRHLHKTPVGQLRQMIEKSQPVHRLVLAPCLACRGAVAEYFDSANNCSVLLANRLRPHEDWDAPPLLGLEEHTRFMHAAACNACPKGTLLH